MRRRRPGRPAATVPTWAGDQGARLPENHSRRGGVSIVVRDDPSDDELLRATAAGDRWAFEQYYRRNAPWLELRLRRRCGDAEVAADLVQEVFLAVWRAAASYRGSGQAGGWLWSIASRRLIDAHRRRLARVSAVGEPHDDLVTAASAEETALAATYDARLAQALQGLAPELRAVLQATVLDGLSVRETSILLNMPEGTVKSRAARARRLLREALA